MKNVQHYRKDFWGIHPVYYEDDFWGGYPIIRASKAEAHAYHLCKNTKNLEWKAGGRECFETEKQAYKLAHADEEVVDTTTTEIPEAKKSKFAEECAEIHKNMKAINPMGYMGLVGQCITAKEEEEAARKKGAIDYADDILGLLFGDKTDAELDENGKPLLPDDDKPNYTTWILGIVVFLIILFIAIWYVRKNKKAKGKK